MLRGDEGLELVATEVVGSGSKTILRLVVDSPDGVNLDQCASVSRLASAMLDVEDPIKGHYNLEVSSPGMDRPLRKVKDFQKFTGALVKLKTAVPFDGQRNFKGHLQHADDDVVVIATDTEEISIPMHALDKARIVPEF